MENKVALVTGAGSGAGRGIARTLAHSGYDVGVHTGSNRERALALAEELRAETGRKIEVFSSDFSKPGGAARLFEQFGKEFDRLDIFVNNAGVTEGGQILGMTEERLAEIFNINFTNAYFCVQQAGKIMVERGIRGSMVLISSNQHNFVGKGNSPYSITKEAIVKYTKHAAIEFAEYGVRVNCIAPGWINTGESRMDGWYERSMSGIPLLRWLQPEEIAQWILFLASPAAASLTGDTIELDGGARFVSQKY